MKNLKIKSVSLLTFFFACLFFTSIPKSFALDRKHRPVFTSLDYDCDVSLERGDNIVQKQLKGNAKLDVTFWGGNQQLIASVDDQIIFENRDYSRFLYVIFKYNRKANSPNFLFSGQIETGLLWRNSASVMETLNSNVGLLPAALETTTSPLEVRTFSYQDGVIYSMFCSLNLNK